MAEAVEPEEPQVGFTEEVVEEVEPFHLLFSPRKAKDVRENLKYLRDLIEFLKKDYIYAMDNLVDKYGRVRKSAVKRALSDARAMAVISKTFARATVELHKADVQAYKAYLGFLQQSLGQAIGVYGNYVPSYTGDIVASIERYKLAKSEFYQPKTPEEEIIALIKAFVPQLPEGVLRKLVGEIMGKFVGTGGGGNGTVQASQGTQ